MPFGHCGTICQWLWLLGWWMEERWMRTQRTLASICIHLPLECICWIILTMDHPNLMLFGASAGYHGMLASGGALQCNGAENAMILWSHCTIIAKSATKNAMQWSKNCYARSLVFFLPVYSLFFLKLSCCEIWKWGSHHTRHFSSFLPWFSLFLLHF